MEVNQLDTKILLEQYKIATEMADRVSARREGANKIFISVNSILLAYLASNKSGFAGAYIIINLFGIALSLVWASAINNYRSLNSAKYEVIQEMENNLPWKVYGSEWNKLNNGKDANVHTIISKVEKKLPYIFMLFYFIMLIYFVLATYGNLFVSTVCAKY